MQGIKIGNKKSKYPIIQGGMGVGISLSKLAGTVAKYGGIGVISVVANVAPKQTHDMCRLYFDGKVKEAAKMQLEMMDLVEKLFIEVNPIPVKNAMNMMGMDVGELKLPLVDLSEENAKKVRKALIDYGIKVIN